MSSVRVLLSTLVASTLGCAKLGEELANDNAKRRVTGVLDGVQKGGAGTSGDVQRAICLWYNGKIIIPDLNTLDHASNLYTAWQNEGGIARTISGFKVTDAERLGDGAILVSGTIENKPFTVKVVEGTPISWVKAPQW